MRKLSIFIAFALVITSLIVTACQPQAQPVTFTDDSGRAITVDKVPERIVSHVPGITEMLFALGLGDRVVGVSDFCDYPPEAKEKPSVGNYFNPSVENIIALDPDLVLTDGHSETIAQLDNLGKKFIVIDPKDINGVFNDLELIGKVAGVESKANELVAKMRQRMDAVTSRVQNAEKVKVFYIVDAVTDPNNPWTAGQGSFIDWLIMTAGGINIAAQTQGSYVQLSLEQVVSAEPDVILVDGSQGTVVVSIDTLKQHPVWSKLSAVQNGKVYYIDGDLTNPVPRIMDGLDAIAKAIHPERFG